MCDQTLGMCSTCENIKRVEILNIWNIKILQMFDFNILLLIWKYTYSYIEYQNMVFIHDFSGENAWAAVEEHSHIIVGLKMFK